MTVLAYRIQKQEAAMLKLRRRYEDAFRSFCLHGHTQYDVLARALSDAILEALDDGMEYPTPTVCQWIRTERSEKQ